MIDNKQPIKNILDTFIERELEIKPNPFLVAKVMDKIVAQNINHLGEFTRERTKRTLIFKFAMTLSASAALALGVFLGSNYTLPSKYNSQQNNSIAVNINDSQLENLYLYNVEE